MRTCPKAGCGQRVDELTATCPSCGAALVPRFARLGPYRTIEEVYDGPRTLTFRARHDTEGIDVALTVFKPEEPLSEEQVDRLSAEAGQLSAICHPRVPRVYGFAQTDDGVWYRAKEWVAARDLNDLTTTGELDDVRHALSLFLAMADALRDMHENELYQPYLVRDDILVEDRPDDGGYHVRFNYRSFRFLDPATDPPAPGLKRLLAIHPDLRKGSATDARSDLFCLGVVFHGLLSGGEWLTSLDDAEFPADRAIPRKLRAILRALLEPDRSDRLRNSAVLVDRLRAIGADDVDQAEREAAAARDRAAVPARTRRFRRSVVGAIAALAIALAIAVWALVPRNENEFAEVFEANRDAVYVLLFSSGEDGTARPSCTAFAVDRVGILATNAHCVLSELEVLLRERRGVPADLRRAIWQSVHARFLATHGRHADTYRPSDSEEKVRLLQAALRDELARRPRLAEYGIRILALRDGATHAPLTVRAAVVHEEFDLAAYSAIHAKSKAGHFDEIRPDAWDIPDLALLVVDLPEGEALPATVALATEAEIEGLRDGDAVGTMGFPFGYGVREGVSSSKSVGEITNAQCLRPPEAGVGRPCRLHFRHKALTDRGASGSPVFAPNGHVVGVHFGGLLPPGAGSEGPHRSALPQFHFAVRADLLAPLLARRRGVLLGDAAADTVDP